METENSNKKISVLIVDDESLARKRIRDLLCKKNDFEIIGECSGGVEAIEAIQNQIPDLLFLDIQMPDIDGFEVLENLKTEDFPTIIFVTAYDKYALKAFEFHAIDYLLKPFKDERFEEMLDHVSRQIGREKIEDLSKKLTMLLTDFQKPENKESSNAVSEIKNSYQTRFVIKSVGKISFIKVDEIDWIGAEGTYVSLNIGNKSNLLRESMKNLEEKLDPTKFIRIHRSTIVNIFRVKELQPEFRGEYLVILENGKRLKLSRSYRENLEKLLNEVL
ncbi:MAG: LytTR family DNA-binding domain-containing protein [Pyrinomonadaceae bacterium]